MDLRLSPRLAHAPSRRAAPAAAAAEEVAKEHALTAAMASAEDFATTYETWTRLTMMNTFVEPGLEASYRAYQLSIYGDRVRKWFLLAAMVATCGTINVELGHLRNDVSLRSVTLVRAQMFGSALVFWFAFLCARSMPKPWLHAFYKRQQVILCSLSCAFGLSIALPGILQPHMFDAPLNDLESFVQGHWTALVAATSLMTLAWSDLSPLIYSVLSIILVAIWNMRNVMMQMGHVDRVSSTNATTMSADHELPFGGLFSVTLLHYLAAWVATVFVSYQKDTLMRRNFVILQIVKVEKDKRIKELRGEKETLEVQLTDLEARSKRQAAATRQHVKFVDRSDNERPRERPTHSFKHRFHARANATKHGSHSFTRTTTRHSMPDEEVPWVRPLATQSHV